MSLPDQLKPLFERIESLAQLDEHAVAHTLGEFNQQNGTLSSEIEPALFAERFVFTLYTDLHGEHGCWGAYFRPMFMSHKDGGAISSHPIERLSPETFAYWTTRAVETNHPVLRARYADAAWELAPLVQDVKRDITNARTAIDAYVAVASASNTVIPTINSLKRGLNLALAIHDDARVQRVVAEMFELARRGADPTEIGTSVAVFDSLFELRKKVKLSEERLQQLIRVLEACLARAAGVDGKTNVDHFSAQRHAERLVRYYRSAGTHEDVIRVTRLMAGAIEKAADAVEPMVAMAWLHDAQVAYRQVGLKDDADRLLLQLKEKGRESKARMIPHFVSQSIPVSEIEAFLDDISEGGLDRCFTKIVTFFLPKATQLRMRLAEMKEKYPLSSLFPISLHDDDQMIATVGSAESDEDGRLVHEIARDMQFWTIFLMQSLERMFMEHDLLAEQFVDILYRTPLWGMERYQILKNGLRHYRDGDHVAAIHVLVPQIEHGCRVLLSTLHRPTNLHNAKLDAYQEKDLGAILADEQMGKLLGEDISRYVRTLLTDQRGWNLRNRLSHGLYDAHFFQRHVADRVIHVLMVLSLFRPSGPE